MEPEENARTIEVRAIADPTEQADEFRLVANVPLHEVVEPHGNQKRRQDHHVQLHVNRASGQVAEPSTQDDKQIEQQNGQRRGGMRATQADEHMMQMRLVGMERRFVLQDARRHHAKRIEDRYRQDSQHEGNQPDILRIVDFAESAVRQSPHDEHRNHNTHDERSAIPDEHLRTLAEEIVKKERNQRPCRHHGQHGHHPISDTPEHPAEEETRQDAIARRKAIHAVDQIDAVDNSNGSHNRQRHGQILWDLMNTPQPVEVIQTVPSDVDQQQHRENLNQETQPRREIENIIQRAGIEHDHHRHNDDEQLRAVADQAGTPQSDDRAEKDGDTSQYGDRFALQFPRIGIIDDILVQSDPHQTRMNPANTQQGDQKGSNVQHGKREILRLNICLDLTPKEVR